LPLYEYKCVKCGHLFEKIESFSASPRKKCPDCGAKAERQMGHPAIQFKGSGWYVTDYAGKKTASSSESSGDGDTSGKTSEKPADSKDKSAAAGSTSSEKSSEKSGEKSADKSSEKSSDKSDKSSKKKK
jgi:putative FmdB family regulatory protein